MKLNRKVLRISSEFSVVLGQMKTWNSNIPRRSSHRKYLHSQLGFQEGGNQETELDENCILVFS